MYVFGCSGALMQIVIHPGLYYAFVKLKWESPLRPVLLENQTEAVGKDRYTRVYGSLRDRLHPWTW
eukprot:scaffold319597_cov175-Cyclotella_meneghiniana.AAC.1